MLRSPHSTENDQHIPRSKRIYGAALAMTAILSGCAGFMPQRPFVMSPPPQVLPPTPVPTNPTQVTPRSDRNTGKPVLEGIEELNDGADESLGNQADPESKEESEVTPTYQPPYSPDRDSEFLPNRKEESDGAGDAPIWTPLRAPESIGNDPTAIYLGEPVKFPASQSQPRAAEKESVQPITQSHRTWNKELLSTSKRPIQMAAIGQGEHRILVLGSLYGNDPESIELVDQFQRLLQKSSLPANYSILVVRTPNPDGLALAMRTNVNGVDLNRNFPSTWFTANPNQQTGPHPASEVETQHMLAVLKDFQPTRVIHIQNGIGHRPLILMNEKWAQGIDVASLVNQVDSTTFGGVYKVGSIEEFTAIRMGIETATIQLPPQGFQQLPAKDLLQLAMQGVSLEDVLPQTPLAQQQPAPPVEGARPDGEKGYVELLPPPPGSQFNQASQSTTDEDPRYYELPPPPQ